MYKLVFYVPEEGKEKIKEALFELGAGTLGHYSHCCFESEGTGQFKPLEGSDPAIGEQERVEYVKEVKVEMLVTEELVPLCIETIKAHHPYEVPAYEFYKVFTSESELQGQEWL